MTIRLSDYYQEPTHEICVDLYLSEDSPKIQLTFSKVPDDITIGFAVNNAIEMSLNPPQFLHPIVPEGV